MRPQTRYALAGELNIAYEVVGEGDFDLVFVPGFASHLDLAWDIPRSREAIERLASFSRVICFDRRGTGLSDPVVEAPTLEESMEDVRAVLDAVGSERAALFGQSGGVPLCLLFAATYPERVSSLVLYGGMARTTEAPDYPWAMPAGALADSALELLAPHWGEGTMAEVFNPSAADDPRTREVWARHERQGMSPRMREKIYLMYLDIDVRGVLPAIRVPTLILHRRGDRVANVRGARWMAEQIPEARMVEFPGVDHWLFYGEDPTPVFDEAESFLTGIRPERPPDRVLATVMFTDIVSSTPRAVELGDARWVELLETHQRVVREQLERFRGEEVSTTGDGFLATFDGPARAIRCGQAIVEEVTALGLEICVGLHAGEVELMDADIGGVAVHIASRVAELAGPGEVLVSGTVKGLVAGSGIELVGRGPVALRGIPEEWELFSVRRGSAQPA